MSDFPSQKQEKFVLRLPDGMRDRIKAAADSNNRSMNAEIVATLEEKYPKPVDDDMIKYVSGIIDSMTPDQRDEFLHGLLEKAGVTDDDIAKGRIPGVRPKDK